MADQKRQLLSNNLPSINRHITDHNKTGQAVFNEQVPATLEWQPIGPAYFALGYTTDSYPVKYTDKATNSTTADVESYSKYLVDKPGIVIPGGTVLRIVDIAPGAVSPMHRTVSLDYGVVLEGEIELILDSGETRLMKRGDVSIQRGTMHAWKNMSDGWSRMLYVLQESETVEIKKEDGSFEKLEEDYGVGMDSVRPSGAKANGH